ncbi:MAG: hypothetical protein WCX65_08960 [bacterium]
MKNYSRIAATLATLLFVLTFSAVSFSQEEPAPQAAAVAPAQPAPVEIPKIAPPFDFKDIYGRVIKAEDLKNWVVVYGFGNEHNADTGIEWIKNLTLAHPNVKGVLYVIVADASKYDKLMYPLVKRVVKQEYKKKLVDIRNEFKEKGLPVDFVLEDRYMMTLDLKADIFNLFGISDSRDIVHFFIVDGNRNVRAHFTEYNQAASDLFGQVIAERDAKQAYQMKTHKRKKNMFRRYALAGAAVWLVSLAF